jgi:hypothetical protein
MTGCSLKKHNKEKHSQPKAFYDEQYKRMDGRLDGRRDVALDGDLRGGHSPARCRDWQAVQEIIMRSQPARE